MNIPPPRAELLERERRASRIAGLTALAAVLLFAAGAAASVVGLDSVDGDAEALVQLHDHSRAVVGQALAGVAIMLLAFPLRFLFGAAANRTDQVRRTFATLVVIGPLLLGLGQVMLAIGKDKAADTFVERSATSQTTAGSDSSDSDDDKDPEEKRAEDTIKDQNLIVASKAVGLAGVLSMIFGMVYTSLWAMRTGLVTRFWGSLGMAVGASMIFLGPYGVMIWFAGVGLQLLGVWPGPRPPAWDTGTAVPWPQPGEPPGQGGTVEGRGREVTDRPADQEQLERPREPGPPPRKRKRRS